MLIKFPRNKIFDVTFITVFINKAFFGVALSLPLSLSTDIVSILEGEAANSSFSL